MVIKAFSFGIIGLLWFWTVFVSHDNSSINLTNKKDTCCVEVKFICPSCKENNRFIISGEERFSYKNVKFPFSKNLKKGKYFMTYHQNNVQQIHLPFSIKSDLDNVVKVK